MRAARRAALALARGIAGFCCDGAKINHEYVREPRGRSVNWLLIFTLSGKYRAGAVKWGRGIGLVFASKASAFAAE
jgi:hypothetical protein